MELSVGMHSAEWGKGVDNNGIEDKEMEDKPRSLEEEDILDLQVEQEDIHRHSHMDMGIGVSSGHESRFNGGRRPVSMDRFQEGSQATNMRTGHGSPRKNVEIYTSVVRFKHCWANVWRPSCQDVHPGGGHIRLDDLGRHGARPSRRKHGHDRGTVPINRALELD
nr:hypothetical protein TorRG33x02_286470 [Ipomoea trifida]